MRLILIIAITYKWQIQQININSIFLNDILQEEVYITQPQDFEISDKSLMCKVNKPFYGLKQASHARYES